MALDDKPLQAPAEKPTEQRASRIPPWIWLGGAFLVLLSLITGLQTRRLQNELSELQDQLREQRLRGLALDTERRRHEDVLAILTSSDTREFQLKPFGRANATDLRVFWNEKRGLLMVGSRLLPVPQRDRTFQLWIATNDGTPVNCGVFRPDAEGNVSLLIKPKVSLQEAQALWITEEPEAGSARPSSPLRWKATIR